VSRRVVGDADAVGPAYQVGEEVERRPTVAGGTIGSGDVHLQRPWAPRSPGRAARSGSPRLRAGGQLPGGGVG
jgi:hypothetical protein